MKTAILKSLLATLALGLAASSAQAITVVSPPNAPNYLIDGSFESGLSGWTMSGTPTSASSTTFPVVAITYGSATPYPTGAYGEPVPVSTNASLSPDAVGSHGAYFVDDHAVNETISQLVYLTAGRYRIGFDAYAPSNGYANFNDASFVAQIAGVTLANYLVSSLPSATWLSFSGLANILTSGYYSASFVFNTPGLGVAKDVVIDRAYIVSSTEIGGRVIPEPETLALIGIALAGIVVTRKRKQA